MAERIHLFPYRTQKLSSLAPKVLSGRLLGRIGHRHISFNASVFRCVVFLYRFWAYRDLIASFLYRSLGKSDIWHTIFYIMAVIRYAVFCFDGFGLSSVWGILRVGVSGILSVVAWLYFKRAGFLRHVGFCLDHFF